LQMLKEHFVVCPRRRFPTCEASKMWGLPSVKIAAPIVQKHVGSSSSLSLAVLRQRWEVEVAVMMAVRLIEHRILLAAAAVGLNLDVNPVLTLIDSQVDEPDLQWVGRV
jgi:hypothetical protein